MYKFRIHEAMGGSRVNESGKNREVLSKFKELVSKVLQASNECIKLGIKTIMIVL